MAATLFADRFLVADRETTIDLASSERTTLRLVTMADDERLNAWLRRCAERLWQPNAPRGALLDFGLASRDRHFEAVSSAPWPARGANPRRTTRGALPMLELLSQLAEVLDGGVSGRPRTIELAVPDEAPFPVVLNLVARESRLRGYIPVHPARLLARAPGRTLHTVLHAVLHGRHVVLLHDGHAPCRAAAARLLLALGLDSDRPHVLLALRGPLRCLEGHGLTRPAVLQAQAREQPAPYGPTPGALPPPSVLRLPVSAPTAWSPDLAAPDLARPRLRVAQALDAASKGRHAAASRALREAFAMLARRGDIAGAAEAAMSLGRLLLARGRLADAAAMFEQARRLDEDAGLQAHAVVAAVHVAFAWTDAGRWLEAEAAARAAVIAASPAGATTAGWLAGLALARCLLWQGRAREADEALPSGEAGGELSPSTSIDLLVARDCLSARVAVAAGDIPRAGLAAARARERATLVGRPLETAAACQAAATVYAQLGDAGALRVQVEEGLRAARLARAPLRAIRLRTAMAAGLLQAGKAAEAKPLVARLSRLDRAALPVVVARPIEHLLQRKSGEVAARARPARDVADTVIELLALCQSITDDEGLARKAVAVLRGRLACAAAACFGLVDGRVAPVAVDGREPAPHEVAQRAADTALALAPASTRSGLEAAVPIRFGGQAIGALGCRWAADVSPDWPASGAILAAAAAALAPCVRAVLDRRAVALPPAASAEEIVGASHAVAVLRDEIRRAAGAPFNVVIEGESGTGKELVARAIHRLGPRRQHRLCAVNCAALTDELLDAELFGHARGAFTGAVAERRGLFEEADGGTLVLDEVSELSPRAQAKLLRVIQEGEVRRVGENLPRPVDARIIAASNRPLGGAVQAGSFRRDLLYRLDVIHIVVPPLRERVDDVPLLAAHFWQQAVSRLGSRATLSPATIAALSRYDWPGNVRELQNVMASLAVSAGRRGSVGPERLPAIVAASAAAVRGATLDEARRLFEVRFVRAALARAGGQRAQAARDLGLTRQGLAKLMARLDI